MWLRIIEPFVKAVDGNGCVHFLMISLSTIVFIDKGHGFRVEEHGPCLDLTRKLSRLLQSRIDQNPQKHRDRRM